MLLDKIRLHLKRRYPFAIKKYRDFKVAIFFNDTFWIKKKKDLFKIINNINDKSFDETLPKNFDDNAKKRTMQS